MATRSPRRSPAREPITGAVLAGGRGSRMGGVDKGLQLLGGRPLVQHALERLAPQVDALMLSANRNLEAYAAFGVPVVSDGDERFAGPLAGMRALLAACRTPWLLTVPCDSPHLPETLAARLATAAAAMHAEIVIAATPEPGGSLRTQPVFALMRRSLLPDLEAFLAADGHKVERWMARHRRASVVFDDGAAFRNANTPEELRALEGGG